MYYEFLVSYSAVITTQNRGKERTFGDMGFTSNKREISYKMIEEIRLEAASQTGLTQIIILNIIKLMGE
jgi:hypothetical protein